MRSRQRKEYPGFALASNQKFLDICPQHRFRGHQLIKELLARRFEKLFKRRRAKYMNALPPAHAVESDKILQLCDTSDGGLRIKPFDGHRPGQIILASAADNQKIPGGHVTLLHVIPMEFIVNLRIFTLKLGVFNLHAQICGVDNAPDRKIVHTFDCKTSAALDSLHLLNHHLFRCKGNQRYGRMHFSLCQFLDSSVHANTCFY